MDLTHRFTVPAGLDETWTAFNDLNKIAPCFPGATITEMNGDEFAGSVKIKLGPISLVYNGTGSFVVRDGGGRKAVIRALGKDKRGNGTAAATVTAEFSADGTGTAVLVTTDLAITGKPAQFGRGVIQDVSDRLLGQFVSCISGQFSAGHLEAEPAPAVEEPVVSETPVTPIRPTTEGAYRPNGVGSSRSYTSSTTPDQEAAELNMVTTVLPVLAKRYGPVLLGGLAAGLVIFKIIKKARKRS